MSHPLLKEKYNGITTKELTFQDKEAKQEY